MEKRFCAAGILFFSTKTQWRVLCNERSHGAAANNNLIFPVPKASLFPSMCPLPSFTTLNSYPSLSLIGSCFHPVYLIVFTWSAHTFIVCHLGVPVHIQYVFPCVHVQIVSSSMFSNAIFLWNLKINLWPENCSFTAPMRIWITDDLQPV